METLRGRRDGAPALPCRSACPVPRPGLLPHPLHRSPTRAHARAHIPTCEPAFTRVPAAPLLATLSPQASQRLDLAIQWRKHTSPRPWTPAPEPDPARAHILHRVLRPRCSIPLLSTRSQSAHLLRAPRSRVTRAAAQDGRPGPAGPPASRAKRAPRAVPRTARVARSALCVTAARKQPQSAACGVLRPRREPRRSRAGASPPQRTPDGHSCRCLPPEGLVENFSVKPTGKGSNGVKELP